MVQPITLINRTVKADKVVIYQVRAERREIILLFVQYVHLSLANLKFISPTGIRTPDIRQSAAWKSSMLPLGHPVPPIWCFIPMTGTL